jgi:Transcriptional activator of glycolytic enzymes
MSVANNMLGTGGEDSAMEIDDEDIEDVLRDTADPAQDQIGSPRGCTTVPVRHEERPNDPVNGSSPSDYKHIQLSPKHASLSDLWEEWYGLGRFNRVAGGINGLEKQFKSKWRKHLEANQFSRTSRVIQAINDLSRATGKSVEEVLAERNEDFLSAQCSVGLLVECWKRSSLIKKNAPRGRQSRKAIEQQRN